MTSKTLATYLKFHTFEVFAVLIVFSLWILLKCSSLMEVDKFSALGKHKFSNLNHFEKQESAKRHGITQETLTNISDIRKIESNTNGTEADIQEILINVEKTNENFQDNSLKLPGNEESTTKYGESRLENLKKAKLTNNTKIMTYDLYEEGFNTTSVHLCPDFGAKKKLAFLITSDIRNKEKRLYTRFTWGHFALRKDIVFAFFVGKTNNSTLLKDIEKENILYRDIIIGNYIDTYRNLTLKSINIIEWVSKYCSNVEFIFKTDDDVFVNVPKTLEFINEHKDSVDKIYGYVWHKSKVVRNSSDKYYIPYSEFPSDTYMDYTAGHAYLFHKNVAKRLYEICFDEIYLSMEDVYITGILAEKLNITRVHFDAFHTYYIKPDYCLLKSAISIHNLKKYDVFNYYFKLFGSKEIVCHKKKPKYIKKTPIKKKNQ